METTNPEAEQTPPLDAEESASPSDTQDDAAPSDPSLNAGRAAFGDVSDFGPTEDQEAEGGASGAAEDE